MKRREFLKTAGITAAMFAGLPRVARAAGETLQVAVTISRNHGHSLNLTPSDVLLLLRQTHGGGPVSLDLQGSSGHPHSLELTHDLLLELVHEGTLQAPSSVVFGHSHDVRIDLAP